jgi:hypothetical protein
VDGELRAQPATLIVPLYHKVRIPLGSVLQVAQWLDKHIEVIRSATATRPARLKSRLVWDVALSTIDAFRKDVRESTLADEEKVRLLTAALPRFVWRLMAHGDKGRLFEILLDPTDLLQGRQFLTVIGYDAQALEFAALALKLVPETSVDSLPAESVRQAMVSIAARVVE